MPGGVEEDEDADEEPEVADAVDDEGLAPCVRLGVVVEPEPDEQVAAEAHPFPADEHRHQVVAEDEEQHRRDEQVEVGEVAPVPGILVDVPDRVEMDEEADAGDDQHQGAAQAIEAEREIDVQAADGEPGVDGLVELRALFARHLDESGEADEEGKQDDDERDGIDPALRDPPSGEPVEGRPEERQERNEVQPTDFHRALAFPLRA